MNTPISTSPANQFDRSVERFNQRALRFTRPGPRWLTTSVKLGFIMKAAAMLMSLAVWAALSAFGGEALPPDSRGTASRGTLEVAFLALVLAPLGETAQIWLVHALTRRWLGLTGFVLVNTLLAYAGHVPTTSIPIAAALVFSVMSYQYVSFRDDLGAGRAFAGVTVSHAVCNIVPVLLVTAERNLGASL